MRSLEDDPSPERKDDARLQIVSKIDSQVDKYKYRNKVRRVLIFL